MYETLIELCTDHGRIHGRIHTYTQTDIYIYIYIYNGAALDVTDATLIDR